MAGEHNTSYTIRLLNVRVLRYIPGVAPPSKIQRTSTATTDVIEPQATSITSVNLATATTAKGGWVRTFNVRWLTMDSGKPREWLKYSVHGTAVVVERLQGTRIQMSLIV